MKTPAPFDLNAAIQVWRQKLAESPSFRVENLDEIEARLRDSVRNIESKGLTPEEVFQVAIGRLGQPVALDQEFGKVNKVDAWRARALWIILGCVLGSGLPEVCAWANALTLIAGERVGVFGHPFSFVIALGWTGAVLLVVLTALFWLLILRLENDFKNILRRCCEYPILAIFGLVFCRAGLYLGTNWLVPQVFQSEVHQHHLSPQSSQVYLNGHPRLEAQGDGIIH